MTGLDEKLAKTYLAISNINVEELPWNGEEIGLTFTAPDGHLLNCNNKKSATMWRRTTHGLWSVARSIGLAGITKESKPDVD